MASGQLLRRLALVAFIGAEAWGHVPVERFSVHMFICSVPGIVYESVRQFETVLGAHGLLYIAFGLWRREAKPSAGF